MKINGSISSNGTSYTKWGEIQGNIENQSDLIELTNKKDTYYSSLISKEADERYSADNRLKSAIETETANRESNDVALGDKIDSNYKLTEQHIEKEKTERIQDIRSVSDGLNERMDKVNSISLMTAVNLEEHRNNETIHVTIDDKNSWNKKSDFSGSYLDLRDKPEIPKNVSQLHNDLNYQTLSDVEGLLVSKVNTTEFNDHVNNYSVHVSTDDRSNWNNKLNVQEAGALFKKLQSKYDSNSEGIDSEGSESFISRIIQDSEGKIVAIRQLAKKQISSYDELTNKPMINGVELEGDLSSAEIGINVPTKVSELENDLLFTSEGTTSLVNYYQKKDTYAKSEIYNKTEVDTKINTKQNKLTAGNGINLEDNIASVKVDGTTITFNSDKKLQAKQAVSDVKVDGASVMSGTTAYINLTNKQNKLKAGTNITIDEATNTISASGDLGSVSWGNIKGSIANQTDLNSALTLKQNASEIKKVAKTGEYADLLNKPEIPTKTSQLTNDSGFITASSTVTDVKVAGASVVSSGVANINYPTESGVNSYPGVVEKTGYGVSVLDNGKLCILKASNDFIDARMDDVRPIVSSSVDYATAKALIDPKKYNWTSEGKAAAQTTLGIKPGDGLKTSNNNLLTDTATADDINNRVEHKTIETGNLDKAVKAALTDAHKLTYTSDEQSAARSTINAAENKVATASAPGLAYANSQNGIYMSTGGQMMLDQATNSDIENRDDTVVHAITAGNYDYAVKEALCNSEGLGLTWTATELASAQHKLGIDDKQDTVIPGNGLQWSVSAPISLMVKPDFTTITFDSTGALKTVNSTASPTWGTITGTLSNQSDLATVLNGKQNTLVAGTGISIDPLTNKISATGSGLTTYIKDASATLNTLTLTKMTNGVESTLSFTPSGGSATDVQVNGTSITSGGVANLLTQGTYGSSNKIATMSDVITDVKIEGVSKVSSGVANLTTSDITNAIKYRGATNRLFGLMTTSNQMWLASAKQSEIDNASLRNNLNDDDAKYRQAITQGNIDYAVKAALTDGIGPAYTTAEQTAAKARLGITSGGAVDSVNGKTGTVVLTTNDLANDSGYITNSEMIVYHDPTKQDSLKVNMTSPTDMLTTLTINGTNYAIVGTASGVSSVNGKSGVVTLNANDVLPGTAYTADEKKALREAMGIFTKASGDPDPSGMVEGDILIVY